MGGGFSMALAGHVKPRQRQKQEMVRNQGQGLTTNEMFIPGLKGEKLTICIYDGFESKKATAPKRAPDPKAHVSSRAAFLPENRSKPSEADVFAIRWVPDENGGEEVGKRIDLRPVEDRRIHLSMPLGTPADKWGSKTELTSRLFVGL